MFYSSAFTGEDIARLKALCGALATRSEHHQARDGTDDEWAVFVVMVEGTVACRRMPNFLTHVLKSEKRLLLYTSIQALKVECDYFTLRSLSGGRGEPTKYKYHNGSYSRSAELARTILLATSSAQLDQDNSL